MIKTSLLSGALGAEVTGVDLKDSSAENWNIINNLLLEHKALFLEIKIYLLKNKLNSQNILDH